MRGSSTKRCLNCLGPFGLVRRIIELTGRQYCCAYCEAWGERKLEERRAEERQRFMSWLYPSSYMYSRPP